MRERDMRDNLDPRGRITGGLVAGLALLALGVMWTLDNLGVLDARSVLDWWPAALILFGVAKLTGTGTLRQPAAGIIFTAIGTYLLLSSLDVIQGSIFRLWPLLLIVFGGSILLRALRGSEVRDGDLELAPRFSAFAFMGSATRRAHSQELQHAEATAVMGGVELDFSHARAVSDRVVVDVFAWWGGIEIVVPADWKVIFEMSVVMGGIEDLRRPLTDPPATTLIVRGMAIMGGIDVRNERPRRGKGGDG